MATDDTKKNDAFEKMKDDLLKKMRIGGQSFLDENMNKYITINVKNAEQKAESLELMCRRALTNFDANLKYLIFFINIKAIISNDEEIDYSALSEQEIKDALNASIELIKCLFPKAITDFLPTEIENISTFEQLDILSEWVRDNGLDLLSYTKRYKYNKEIGKIYNVELFQLYSVIASIGYGVTLLKDSYGDKWAVVVNSITAVRMRLKEVKWGTVPKYIENPYQFAITYQPNKINQYIIKLLLDMGFSRSTVLKLPIPQNKKATTKDFEGVTLPTLPITLED